MARPRRRSPGNWESVDIRRGGWKKDYLRHLRPAQLDGEQMGPEEMLEKIRQLRGIIPALYAPLYDITLYRSIRRRAYLFPALAFDPSSSPPPLLAEKLQ